MNSRPRYLWFRHAAVVVVAGACVVTIAMLGGGGSKLRLALEAVPMAMAMVGVAALFPLPRRPLRAAVAMLLLAPFAAFSILTFAGRPVLASIVDGVLPTDSLVAEVTGQESFTRDAWAELRTRELTVVQTAALVDGLCARDAAALHAGSDAAAWLVAEAAAGRLTSDQRRALLVRWVGLGFTKVFDVPTLVRDTARGLAGAFPGWSVTLVRGEVRPPAAEPANSDHAAVVLTANELATVRSGAWGSDSLPVPELGPWPKAPFHATIWLIGEPLPAAVPLRWRADGSPDASPDALVQRLTFDVGG